MISVSDILSKIPVASWRRLSSPLASCTPFTLRTFPSSFLPSKLTPLPFFLKKNLNFEHKLNSGQIEDRKSRHFSYFFVVQEITKRILILRNHIRNTRTWLFGLIAMKVGRMPRVSYCDLSFF